MASDPTWEGVPADWVSRANAATGADAASRIILIEAADRILPVLPARISEATLRLLLDLGVEVRTGAKVSELWADGVYLASGELIPSENSWCGPASKGRSSYETSMGSRSIASTSWSPRRHCRRAAIPAFSPSAIARHVRAKATRRRYRLVLRRLIDRPRISSSSCAAGSRDRRSSLSSTASSVPSCRSASSTVGSLMGFLVGKNIFIEGYSARLMYRSLYKMHEYPLHGGGKVFLGSLARGLSRRAEPQVKLRWQRYRWWPLTFLEVQDAIDRGYLEIAPRYGPRRSRRGSPVALWRKRSGPRHLHRGRADDVRHLRRTAGAAGWRQQGIQLLLRQLYL
jgi:hypothetical protein